MPRGGEEPLVGVARQAHASGSLQKQGEQLHPFVAIRKPLARLEGKLGLEGEARHVVRRHDPRTLRPRPGVRIRRRDCHLCARTVPQARSHREKVTHRHPSPGAGGPLGNVRGDRNADAVDCAVGHQHARQKSRPGLHGRARADVGTVRLDAVPFLHDVALVGHQAPKGPRALAPLQVCLERVGVHVERVGVGPRPLVDRRRLGSLTEALPRGRGDRKEDSEEKNRHAHGQRNRMRIIRRLYDPISTTCVVQLQTSFANSAKMSVAVAPRAFRTPTSWVRRSTTSAASPNSPSAAVSTASASWMP